MEMPGLPMMSGMKKEIKKVASHARKARKGKEKFGVMDKMGKKVGMPSVMTKKE